MGEEESNYGIKKSKVGWILFGVVIVVLVAFVLSLKFGSNAITGNVVGNNCDIVQVAYEDSEPYMRTEYYTETVPYTDKECENVKLKFTMDNSVSTQSSCTDQREECIDYNWIGGCSKKVTYCQNLVVSCSRSITNLDDEQGVWKMNYVLYNDQGGLVGTKDVGVSLQPQTQEITRAQFIFTGRETADKNYRCGMSGEDVPVKEVCTEVTKYKDVQKERQVQDFRSVTKYRNETQCN